MSIHDVGFKHWENSKNHSNARALITFNGKDYIYDVEVGYDGDEINFDNLETNVKLFFANDHNCSVDSVELVWDE